MSASELNMYPLFAAAFCNVSRNPAVVGWEYSGENRHPKTMGPCWILCTSQKARQTFSVVLTRPISQGGIPGCQPQPACCKTSNHKMARSAVHWLPPHEAGSVQGYEYFSRCSPAACLWLLHSGDPVAACLPQNPVRVAPYQS